MPNQRTSYRLWSKLKATGPTQIAVLLWQADNYQNVFWCFVVCLFGFFWVPWETGLLIHLHLINLVHETEFSVSGGVAYLLLGMGGFLCAVKG